jgi:small subunit ribosomal protein S1
MSWTRRVEHPAEVVHKGQQLEVMVLDVDSENKRISLGVKQLQDDPWPGISERLAPRVEQDGKVVRLQEKGFVVDLGNEIEGFVPVSNSGVDDAAKLEEYYGAGDVVSLRVVESDAANRRIVLEITELPARKSQEQIEAARAAAVAAAAAAEAAAKAGEEDDDAEIIAATQAGKRNKSPRSDGGSRGSRDRGPAPASPAPAAVVEASAVEGAPTQEG